jgi:hypothetical protein
LHAKSRARDGHHRAAPVRHRASETPAAGAKQFAAAGPGIDRGLIGIIDHGIADAIGQPFLQLPSVMQHIAKRINVVGAKLSIGRFRETNHVRNGLRFAIIGGDLL